MRYGTILTACLLRLSATRQEKKMSDFFWKKEDLVFHNTVEHKFDYYAAGIDAQQLKAEQATSLLEALCKEHGEVTENDISSRDKFWMGYYKPAYERSRKIGKKVKEDAGFDKEAKIC